MDPNDLIEWVPLWKRRPPEERDVLVKVAHKDGTFGHDIGKLFAEGGWLLQTFPHASVVAWCQIPKG
jgi:hypothetical protein